MEWHSVVFILLSLREIYAARTGIVFKVYSQLLRHNHFHLVEANKF